MQSSMRKCLALSCGLMTLLSAQTVPAQARNFMASTRQAAAATAATAVESNQPAGDRTFKGAEGSGTLVAMLGSGKQQGQCPLKHTDVNCDISGYIARVTVKQTFHNPFNNKIEAVYTFPLSENGAVDEMLMKVGDRTIHGTIKKREEARRIYDAARAE